MCVCGVLYIVRVATGRNLAKELVGEHYITRILISIASAIALFAFIDFIWEPYRSSVTVPKDDLQWITEERERLEKQSEQRALEQEERERLRKQAEQRAAEQEEPDNISSGSSLPTVFDLDGLWAGSAYQSNARNKKNYRVLLTITNDNGSLKSVAEYPELNCRGEGVFLNEVSSGRFLFRERIVSGRSRCIDGDFTLQFVNKNVLDWKWATGMATAKLQRSDLR